MSSLSSSALPSTMTTALRVQATINVHRRIDQLLGGRIENKLAVDIGDPAAGHRPVKGNIGERQGAGGAGQGQDIGIILLIGGKDRGDNLGFGTIALGKQRAQGPIDDPAGQHLVIAWPADLPAEIIAGNPADRRPVFPDIRWSGAGNPASGLFSLTATDRDQHHGSAAPYDNRT